MTAKKAAGATVEPAIVQTTTSAEKAALEREISSLTTQATLQKNASVEAAQRRASIEQRRAALAVEAARLAELEIDETARVAYEQQVLADRKAAAKRAEATREVEGLIAQRTATLARIETLAAELGAVVAQAFTLAGQVDSTLGRVGFPVANAAPHARALQRHMASRLSHLLGGSLGGRIHPEFRDLARTPLVRGQQG